MKMPPCEQIITHNSGDYDNAKKADHILEKAGPGLLCDFCFYC